MKKSEMNHINLYAKDFKSYIWLDYCKACRVARRNTTITIYFAPEDVMNEEKKSTLGDSMFTRQKYSKMYYVILYPEDFSRDEWKKIVDICGADDDWSEIVIYYNHDYLETECA